MTDKIKEELTIPEIHKEMNELFHKLDNEKLTSEQIKQINNKWRELARML